MNWFGWPILFSSNSSATFWPTVISLSVFLASARSILMIADFFSPENSGSSSKWPWKVWTNLISLPADLRTWFFLKRAIDPALKVWVWIMSGFVSLTSAKNSFIAKWSAIGLIARPKWLMRWVFTSAIDGSSASAPWTKPVS